jgi:hypothetical protein
MISQDHISTMVERRGPANSHTFEMDDDRKKRAVEDTCDRVVDVRAGFQVRARSRYAARRIRPPNGGRKRADARRAEVYCPSPGAAGKAEAAVYSRRSGRGRTGAGGCGLPQDEQKVVMKEAEERARANGYDKNGEDTHFWQMGVDVTGRQIYNRETGGDASVIVSDR